MACRVVFIMLPVLTYSVIEVNIKASKMEPDIKINVLGSQIKIIEENERQVLHINDKQLKKAIMNVFQRKPDDVFVRSPTPWNDLYEIYDWDEVEINIFAKQAKLLRKSDNRVNVTVQAIINNSSSNVTFKAEILGKIVNSVISKWNVSKKETGTDDIFYNIDFSDGENYNIKFGFASGWGVENIVAKPLRVGSGFDMTTIELEPGSALVTTLTAMKTTLELQIDYKANLKGDVAYNYARKHKGHHFWRYPMNKLLLESGLSNDFNFQELLTVKVYYDAVFLVKDSRSGTTLLSLPIDLHESDY